MFHSHGCRKRANEPNMKDQTLIMLSGRWGRGGDVWKGAPRNSLSSNVLDLDLEGLWEHLPNRHPLAQIWYPRPRTQEAEAGGSWVQGHLGCLHNTAAWATQRHCLRKQEWCHRRFRERLRPLTLHLSPVHTVGGENWLSQFISDLYMWYAHT